MRIYQRYVARKDFEATSELARQTVLSYTLKNNCTKKYAEHQIGKRVRIDYDALSGVKPVKEILQDILKELEKGSV